MSGLSNGRAELSGRTHIGQTDYLDAVRRCEYETTLSEPTWTSRSRQLTDPTSPPEGNTYVYLCSYAPYHLKDCDWTRRREDFGTQLANRFRLRPDLQLIIRRHVITPLDLEQIYDSQAATSSVEPPLDQLSPFVRPRVASTKPRPGFTLRRGDHPGGGAGAPCEREPGILATLKRATS